MKPIVVILVVLCTLSSARAQYTKGNLKLESATAQPRYLYQHLQLYPIYANAAFVAQHKSLGKYVALKDALGKKKVTIIESNGEK
jgi:hypothetical protein